MRKWRISIQRLVNCHWHDVATFTVNSIETEMQTLLSAACKLNWRIIVCETREESK